MASFYQGPPFATPSMSRAGTCNHGAGSFAAGADMNVFDSMPTSTALVAPSELRSPSKSQAERAW